MGFKLWPDDDVKVQKLRIGKIPTLVLRPAKIAEIPVAVLWIHGGGYILGMKEMVYMSRAVDLVKNYGVTVFSPGYRLAWQKPYPAAVSDCYKVLRYINRCRGGHTDDQAAENCAGLRSNQAAENRAGLTSNQAAESLGNLKFDKVVVGGESAGGSLAAAICMMARDRGIHVDYQMPLYPMISNIDTDSSRNNHGKIWNTRRNHFGWRLYLRSEARKNVSPYAAPAQQNDYTGLPPCYTFVGRGEPFYRETLDYVSALKAAGVEAEVDVYPSNVHAFDMLRPEDAISKEAIRKFNQHFQKVLEI